MNDLVGPLVIFGALLAAACFVWLNIRAIKDGAAPDILLLLTGISLVAYIFTQ